MKRLKGLLLGAPIFTDELEANRYAATKRIRGQVSARVYTRGVRVDGLYLRVAVVVVRRMPTGRA
jgi:hypothetical protein